VPNIPYVHNLAYAVFANSSWAGDLLDAAKAVVDEEMLMNSGKTAVVLVGGYLLGRFHKARWAMALAGAAAGRRMRAKGGEGVSGLLQSPEVGKLTENLRGQLVGVGKAAAVAAASRRMDALTGKLADRTEALRAGPGDEDDEDRDQDDEGQDRDQDDEQADDEGDEAPRKPKRATAKSGSRTTKSGSGSGAAKSRSGAAKKAASGTARKTSARSTSSGAAKKKAASGGRTRTQTARKSTAAKQAGGRAKGR
jgi:hypothetical protein